MAYHEIAAQESWFDGEHVYVDINSLFEALPPTETLVLTNIAFESETWRPYSSALKGLESLTLTAPASSSIGLWHLLSECAGLKCLRLQGDIEVTDAPLPFDTALETIQILQVESLIDFCKEQNPPTFPNLRELTIIDFDNGPYIHQFLSVNSTIERFSVWSPITYNFDFLSRSLPHLRKALLCDINLSTLYAASSGTEWNLKQLQELIVYFFDQTLDPEEVERVIQNRMLRMSLSDSVVSLREFRLGLPLTMVDVVNTPRWQNSRLLVCADVETRGEFVQYIWKIDRLQ
ncbi:hypothetical protein PIIN_09631 [Serendipita indica DSM 11827]|uniref:F-box domain-containing protein n=1 Tax=Serendipita indica (strain DSM 11827) TaxID=1109443 RepID=G4TWE7_SERID|nr:hypothetical protein PIIN_09631 [Serendipita indica DSM 11827]